MSEKKLDPRQVDVDSFEVEELEQVAGGILTPAATQDANCGTCTCPE